LINNKILRLRETSVRQRRDALNRVVLAACESLTTGLHRLALDDHLSKKIDTVSEPIVPRDQLTIHTSTAQ
jgi:hypothetical protein